MVNTKVTLCGIEMDNPIIPASGTFGYGYEFAELYDINYAGYLLLQGYDPGAPLRQPHAPHRGVRRRPAERGGSAKPRRGRGDRNGAAQAASRYFTSR